MKVIEKVYHYLFYALVFTIPFEDNIRIVPNILMGVLFVLLPFVEKSFKHKLISNKTYLIAIVFTLFIGLTSLVFGTFSDDFNILKKLLILIAVIILSIPIQRHTNVLLLFILSVALGNLISIFNIGLYVWEVGGFEIASGEKINEILFIERLYFGFINCLSIAFSLRLWSKSSKILKRGFIVSILFSVFMILLVASRMAILTSLVICFLKILHHTNVKKTLIALGLGLCVIVAMFFLNDNLAKRFMYVDKQKDLLHKIREWEPRFVIWKCGFSNVASSNHELFLGDGFYQTQQRLNDCYINSISKEKRLKYFLETRFNTHNQYLDLLLSKGIFGLCFLLLLIYWLIHKNKRDINQLNILIVLVLFGLVENFLHRQIGVYLFALVLVVLTVKNSEDNILDE
ncbi:O-antigen ligase family protein [Psychroserpens luteus]|uniref:O-antigen ligase family protein n=1 Tax=Psychroserpens luteus TaxID=1434066 RepID=A0ABW5ZVE4_9FLAO|nr:O-antigen ligase family protein [Psychroserpens luteus]